MQRLCEKLNNILRNSLVLGNTAPLYDVVKIKIENKTFNDSKSALSEFSIIANGSGWFCHTGSSDIVKFSPEKPADINKAGWLVDGEVVSSDGKVSARVSQSSDGKWLLEKYLEGSDGSMEYIAKNITMRCIGGGKFVYQVGYKLEDGKLLPAWQRFVGMSGN